MSVAIFFVEARRVDGAWMGMSSIPFIRTRPDTSSSASWRTNMPRRTVSPALSPAESLPIEPPPGVSAASSLPRRSSRRLAPPYRAAAHAVVFQTRRLASRPTQNVRTKPDFGDVLVEFLMVYPCTREFVLWVHHRLIPSKARKFRANPVLRPSWPKHPVDRASPTAGAPRTFGSYILPGILGDTCDTARCAAP